MKIMLKVITICFSKKAELNGKYNYKDYIN